MQTQPARNICMLLKLERIPQLALCIEPPKSIWKKKEENLNTVQGKE